MPPAPVEAISSFWRKNTSPVESVELANLLRALRKVAGHLGRNAGSIEYAGMSSGQAADIVLPPGVVLGRYPVPADKVDYLVGLVTHEALHRIEWTDRVWRNLEPDFRGMGGLSRVRFQKLVHTGEDIYVDLVADRTVFGRYTPLARGMGLQEARSGLRPGGPFVDTLAYLWWRAVWPGESEADTPLWCAEYREPLDRLGLLTRGLRDLPLQADGVVERCRLRADLYRTAWGGLKGRLDGWDVIVPKLHWFSSSPGEAAPPQSPPANRPADRKQGLAPALARSVEKEACLYGADITPLIREAAGPDASDVAPTSRWDFHIPAHPVVDRRMVGRLKAIFQNYAAPRSLVSRGLTAGKVDPRRLHRAPVTGRCFRENQRVPNLDWNVTLLLDASGSMRGRKWRLVEHTVANLYRALQGYRNRLQAYAYFELDGVCMISRLTGERGLFSVPPNGQTASGQAIIAAACFMPKGRSRRLLLHVTDGQSNFGCDVRHGIRVCAEQGITLLTLGCGTRDREAMEQQYGNTIQFLDRFERLPAAVESLLRWAFLYGARPGLRPAMTVPAERPEAPAGGSAPGRG